MIIVYATAAFVIIELVNNVYETLNLPEWTPALTLIILAIGFPIALIFSWIFDVTPVGIEKTKSSKEIPKGEKSSTPNSWRIASYISFVVIVALILFHVQSRTSPSEVKAILEKSIAVLPFVNMSDDDEFAHFGDVITDEIIMQLYKINAFEVRSRTSIMQYKNTGKGSPAIGRELNVPMSWIRSLLKFG